jgi:hypothetical protein
VIEYSERRLVMIGTMLQGINVKRFVMATLAVFAAIFVTDFLIHGVLMKSAYESTASLWRPKEEMKCVWMLLGQLLIAKGFTFLFVKGYEGRGIGEGLRFGFFVWPLVMGGYFIQYAVSPLPCSIVFSWVVAVLAQLLVMGTVASKVYKR